jgi:4'-phosphopantetheinyl transferase
MIPSSFRNSPSELVLGNDQIHIWYCALHQEASRCSELIQTLSLDELIRAEKFHFDRDRKNFIVCRGVLRETLGHYLGVEPDQIQFCYGKFGKPALVDTSDMPRIRFNLSHSKNLAVYAFTRDREIGVDIEHTHHIPEMDQIAEQFFSARENAVFCALPPHKKKEGFFNCWTRKEAFIKAIGGGLSVPLNKFDVSLAPGEPARLLKIEGDSQAASRWTINELQSPSGFAAAVTVEGRSWRLRPCRWIGATRFGSRLKGGLQHEREEWRAS